MNKDLIIWLQRVLNPASIERWGRDNNLQLPIGQIIGLYLKTILNQIVPLSGAVIDYISKDIQAFIKKDPDLILKEMQTQGAGLDITEDLNFNIFGQKFTIAGKDTTLVYLGIGALVLFLAYGFLKD